MLPRRLAPVLPSSYSSSFLGLRKALTVLRHSGFPCRACAHCTVFAPAAPRRAWTCVSESISGLPLSGPVPVLGYVVLYTTYYLIGHRLILRQKIFHRQSIPAYGNYGVLASVSRGYPPPGGRLSACY